MMRMKHVLCALTVFCVLPAMGSQALAAPNTFICAAAEAVACAPDEPCTRGSAAKVNLPLIWKVNFKEKIIVSLRETGEERTSKILEVIEEENSLILNGG